MRTAGLVETDARRMRAACLVGPGRIRVVSLPVPRPGRGEALVRVEAVGICRSDVHYYLFGRIGSQVVRRYPQMLGHEPAGAVAALGSGVRGLEVGDRVAVEPAAPCGKCAECRRGRGNICARVKFLGMPGLAGAFAEYLAMPVRNLFRIPPAVSYEEAAALEPFAIGLHAVGLLGARRIEHALVAGAGPVGLSVLAALKLGKRRVTVCDYLPARLRVAARMGADRTVRVLRSRGGGAGARRLERIHDAVFEAGGTVESVDLSLRAAAPGGVVALIGILEGDTVPVDMHVPRRKELTIVNVRRSNGELAAGIRYVAAGRADLRPMITHRGGLEETARLFKMTAGYRNGVVKAMVMPWA